MVVAVPPKKWLLLSFLPETLTARRMDALEITELCINVWTYFMLPTGNEKYFHTYTLPFGIQGFTQYDQTLTNGPVVIIIVFIIAKIIVFVLALDNVILWCSIYSSIIIVYFRCIYFF